MQVFAIYLDPPLRSLFGIFLIFSQNVLIFTNEDDFDKYILIFFMLQSPPDKIKIKTKDGEKVTVDLPGELFICFLFHIIQYT